MPTVPVQFKRRAAGGAAGAPADLLSGQPAYNMQDGKIYIGYGDNGSGEATSIKTIGKDDFLYNLPAGTNGYLLGFSGGAPVWIEPPEGGATYTAGTGLDLTGSEFEVDFDVVASKTYVDTGLSGKADTSYVDAELADKADASAVTSALAGKANTSHTHSASDITSGVFDVARIPVMPSQVQIISTGGIAALDSGQQADIGQGTVVTTTDGRRWIYKGSGSKTTEGSYIEMADISPEWTAIANKPSFHAVATSGDYDDLTDKPTLGTMASQNANNVNITGGTIDGVVIDGGTF